MKRKKPISPPRIRRFLLPSAELLRFTGIALLGLVLALVGGFMSFQEFLWPFFTEVGKWWDGLLGQNLNLSDTRQLTHFLGGITLAAGAYIAYRGGRAFFTQLNSTAGAAGKSTVVSDYLRRQQLARGPRIVALGGGTGLSTLLRGLKQYSSNITAIVTVTDDGGSSGNMIKDLGILPPGDMRNCLVALADAEKRMTDLFNHRFTQGSGAFSGHSIGNIIMAGFIEQAGGDIDRALELASGVLAIRGRVLPSTTDHVTLRAVMDDGSEICGETAIVAAEQRVRRIFLSPSTPRVHPDALQAIKEADLICIGPGSVYTSVVPNLLVPGIAQALNEAEGVRAYVCNIMTQPGESDQFTAAEHVVAIQANVPLKVFDFVLVNTGSPTQATLDKYQLFGQDFVSPDLDRIKQMGFRPVSGNLMSETDFVRHDPARVADMLTGLLYR